MTFAQIFMFVDCIRMSVGDILPCECQQDIFLSGSILPTTHLPKPLYQGFGDSFAVSYQFGGELPQFLEYSLTHHSIAIVMLISRLRHELGTLGH